MDADLPALEKKLATYSTQYAQVEMLLQQDPTNSEWLKLQVDLQEVIQLTKDFVKVRESQETGDASASAAAPAEGGTEGGGGADAPQDPNWKPTVGEPCEAAYDKRWYPVHVSAAHDDNCFSVVFFTHGNTEVVDAAQLRALQTRSQPPLDSTNVEAGQICQALFSADRKWYTAKVEEVTEHGARVTFAEYSNSEEVPFEWLRLAIVKTKKQKRKAKRDGIVAIPEYLQIVPTDNEKEIKSKQKRIKAIKKKNKRQVAEIDRKKKQSSWLKFHKKTKGKRISGSMNSRGKKSIFQSPDSLDGKVGVTGSGQGMTDFQKRKKYRLNHG